MITFALTSCGRLDLLQKTLDSFFKFNTAQIEQFIISEDDFSVDLTYLKNKYKEKGNFVWLQNDKPERIGMLANIDKAYKSVKTDYIFHCEDDWEFYREGFIEESMSILNDMPNILQVWLREHNDTNGHPLDEFVYSSHLNDTPYKLVSLDYLNCFNGYSTNPGLRRKKDVVCFEAISKLGPPNIGPEGRVSLYYKYAGFRAAITMNGAVKHIGEGRTTL